MKEFIAICGAVLLGLVLVGLLNGTAGNTTGSLAGSAKSVVSQANSSITDIFP
jgi:hypothetical protein